jgi:hypothetical protein
MNNKQIFIEKKGQYTFNIFDISSIKKVVKKNFNQLKNNDILLYNEKNEKLYCCRIKASNPFLIDYKGECIFDNNDLSFTLKGVCGFIENYSNIEYMMSNLDLKSYNFTKFIIITPSLNSFKSTDMNIFFGLEKFDFYLYMSICFFNQKHNDVRDDICCNINFLKKFINDKNNKSHIKLENINNDKYSKRSATDLKNYMFNM